MKTARVILVLVLLFVLADVVVAARLHGTIYDIELNELNGVVVEIDSEPKQRFVSKNGTYSFELNPGTYELTANYSRGCVDGCITKEAFTISEEGEYVFDLFLFPGFDEDDEDLLGGEDPVDISETVINGNGKSDALTIAIIAVSAIVILLILYIVFGRKKHEEEQVEMEAVEDVEDIAKQRLKEELDKAGMRKPVKKQHGALEDDLQKVVDIIRSEGGRTTQKELRKHFPLSEAKISLMVSELEHKKIVKKVKKGRGNIIILKK
jgi:uncharacterized membrane protein